MKFSDVNIVFLLQIKQYCFECIKKKDISKNGYLEQILCRTSFSNAKKLPLVRKHFNVNFYFVTSTIEHFICFFVKKNAFPNFIHCYISRAG